MPDVTNEIERTSPMPGVAQLTLNRPDKLNAMTTGLVAGLHRHLDDIAVDPDVRVVVLTGAGRAFCAGLDLKDAAAGTGIGGGLLTALQADLRIASDDSQFGVPAARLGLGYGFGGVEQLLQLVGPSWASEILFSARRLTAAEAETLLRHPLGERRLGRDPPRQLARRRW